MAVPSGPSTILQPLPKLFQWLTALKVPFPLNRLPFRDLSLGSPPIEQTAISDAYLRTDVRLCTRSQKTAFQRIGTLRACCTDPEITNVTRAVPLLTPLRIPNSLSFSGRLTSIDFLPSLCQVALTLSLDNVSSFNGHQTLHARRDLRVTIIEMDERDELSRESGRTKSPSGTIISLSTYVESVALNVGRRIPGMRIRTRAFISNNDRLWDVP